jgi:hypothetical protein
LVEQVLQPYAMNDRKREILAEKFSDLGNYAIVTLAFSQIVAQDMDWNSVFLAILFWVTCFIIMNVILP